MCELTGSMQLYTCRASQRNMLCNAGCSQQPARPPASTQRLSPVAVLRRQHGALAISELLHLVEMLLNEGLQGLGLGGAHLVQALLRHRGTGRRQESAVAA